jgi:hypothetical protein
VETIDRKGVVDVRGSTAGLLPCSTAPGYRHRSSRSGVPLLAKMREALRVKSAEDQRRGRAKKQAVKAMVEVASRGETISYTDLTRRITALSYRPNASAFARLLSDVSPSHSLETASSCPPQWSTRMTGCRATASFN